MTGLEIMIGISILFCSFVGGISTLIIVYWIAKLLKSFRKKMIE